MSKIQKRNSTYQKAKKRLSMVPAKGNQHYKPERESFMKAQINKLLHERDKYAKLKENAKSKKEQKLARLCLRTINDSLADYRKKVS